MAALDLAGPGVLPGLASFVVQPPDPVVPSGNADALADAIVSILQEVAEGRPIPPTVPELLARYSRENAIDRLHEAIHDQLARREAASNTATAS